MTPAEAMARAERAQAAREALEETRARDEAEAAALAERRAELGRTLGVLADEHAAARAAGGLPGSVIVCAALLGILLTVVLYYASWGGHVCH
jgi:hypothetical protein